MSGPTAETRIGTDVIETPARVPHPEKDEYVDLRNLSKDGYLRKLAALRAHVSRTGTVNVDDASVLTFDTDRWNYREEGGHHVLAKSTRDPAKDGGDR